MPTYLNGVEQGGGGAGGLYGMNVEVLGAGKALTPGTDEIYQYLNPAGANRIITLDTASATLGDRFVIRHNGAFDNTLYLEVKQAAISLDKIYAGAIKEFIFDGTNWVCGETGAGENDNKKYNVIIGSNAMGYNYGVGVGRNARGYTEGVAVGLDAYGYNYGVAIGLGSYGFSYGVGVGWGAQGYDYGVGVGDNARGYTEGVAIGCDAYGYNYGVAIGRGTKTNVKKYSIALGYQSETERTGETSVNINGDDSDQENNVVQGRWEGQLAGGAGATEIFCAGQANERFTVRASSHLAFRITVVARDNVANEGAMYTFEGLIKRDAAGNTVLSVVNKVVVWEDDAAWDCNVTADDANEALIITVTGDGANITQWAAVMNGVETHF